jgi:preprotein translocase subunit YajC
MEGGLSSLIFLVLFGGIFYFMLIRPQKRRVQQHRALMSSLALGDEVVTIGGLYGTVRRLSDDDIDLEVASGVTLRVLRSAVARKVTATVGEPESGTVEGEGT